MFAKASVRRSKAEHGADPTVGCQENGDTVNDVAKARKRERRCEWMEGRCEMAAVGER
jgi:hypothetical protein